MSHRYADIAFTETIKRVQETHGSRKSYARFEAIEEPVNQVLGPREAGFIGERDSFYMASVSETGWPYVQHRGGPTGFVRVLDERTIGFADFRGNRQYISVGNMMTDDRVSLFFMDYAHRTRLKMLGRARLVDLEENRILNRLELPEYRAKVERGIVIRIEGFDWNCPQHITPRYSTTEVQEAITPLKQRIAELEATLAAMSGATANPT